MNVRGLQAPPQDTINIVPSPEQWEMYKNLLPNRCPHCGGTIKQALIGNDEHGHERYVPECAQCGSRKLPQIILGGGAAGGGKAMVLDSEICTPFGFRKLRDIKLGDLISNPVTGGMQEVVWLHPIEKHPYYRVKFVDGTYVDCSEGHLWKCHASRKKSKKAKKYGCDNDKIWPTKKMYEYYERKKAGMYKGCNLIIPLTEPVVFTVGCHKPKIDPYVLGAIIGDGCMTEAAVKNDTQISFVTMDEEIVARFEKAGYDMSRVSKIPECRASQYRIVDKNLIAELRKLGQIGNRSQTHFLPREYMLASIEDRISLMQGLIDTDGYVDSRGHITYTSTSKQLAEDVAFVVRSLGGVATITQHSSAYTKENGERIQCSDHYDVQIRSKMNPDFCGLSRKRERARHDFNGGVSELGKRIVDIEYIGVREGRCITVNDPSGLYITNDFTVTHNSYLGSAWIVSSCMMFPEIRAIVARRTIKSLKDSTFNTIKMIMRKWKLEEQKHYKINNLEGIVTFWNGSQILLRELEDLPSDSQFERLGSLEATIGFVDEVSEISQKAIEVLFSRLRWKTHYFAYPRLLLTTNPCTNWVRSTFVQDDNGNPIELPDHLAYQRFTVYSNPDKAFIAVYEASLQKITDKALRARLLYGNWDYVDTNEIACYWKFSGETHLVDNLREKAYNPLAPIILSFDFNTAPYMSCLAIQVDWEKKNIYVLEEILGRPEDKENNTPKFAEKIRKKYMAEQHAGGLMITGDPAGLQRSTLVTEGSNNFTTLQSILSDPMLRPQKRILPKQPAHVTRLEFINSLFEGYGGWTVSIDMRCRRFTEDLLYQKRNSDGTKSKVKITDPKLGVQYEKYGHLSDCFDMFCCTFITDAWKKFQARTSTITTIPGSTTVYGAFDY